MENRYFLATSDGILKPVNEADEIAQFKTRPLSSLTSIETTLSVEITVFFPQPMVKPLMQNALRAAVQIVQTDATKDATTEQTLFFVRANWQELALTAYKNYLRLGRGCLYFAEGILNWNSFAEVPLSYVSRDGFFEYPVADVAKHLIDSYEPETNAFIYIQQPQPFWLVAGENFGLPRPKLVWNQHKDDPKFSGLLMSILLSNV